MTGMISTRLVSRSPAGIGLTLLSLAIFTYAFFAAQDFRAVSSWFPVGVSVVGFVLALTVMMWELGIVQVGVNTSMEGDALEGDATNPRPAWQGFLDYMAWLVVLVVAMMTVGAPVAVFIWLLLFFRFKSKEGWLRSVLFSVAAVAGMVLLVAVLHFFVPVGALLPSGSWIPHLQLRF